MTRRPDLPAAWICISASLASWWSPVPGSVPALEGLIKPYAGEYMAPFTAAASEALYQ